MKCPSFTGILASCLIFSVSAASASVVYISNLATSEEGEYYTGNHAQAFTTGPNTDGYLLNTIGLNAEISNGAGGGNFYVSICADSGGAPGVQIAPLSGPTPYLWGAYTYTPSSSVILAKSTQYWIVVTDPTVNFDWQIGGATAVASGGWSLGNNTTPTSSSTPFDVEVRATPVAHVSRYFQDFSAFSVGTTNFGDGSTLFSDHLGSVGAVQDGLYKELGLTASGTINTRSAFELPNLDPGTPIYAFSVKWNEEVNGNFPNAADGFSFNFGQLSSLNLAGSGYSQESGYGTGICFGVQTYPANNPGFYLRVNGVKYASVTNDPTTQWGTSNTTRHFFEVDWNYTNGVTARMDGQIIFANVSTFGFSPGTGDRFVWAARCGSQTEEVRLDNIAVVTGGNLVQVPASSPYYASYAGYPGHGPNTAFDGNTGTFWLGLGASGYIGATVSPASFVLGYSVSSSVDTGSGSATDPSAWSLDGSYDGTNWFSSGTGGGYFVNRMETRAWLASNPTDYGAYRLNISSTAGDGPTTMGELRLYGFNAVLPPWTKISAGVPAANWESIASSADGKILWAGSSQQGAWVYGFSGSPAWSETTGDGYGSNQWISLACSADGQTVSGSTALYQIFNIQSGMNWTKPSYPVGGSHIACSSDGVKQVLAGNDISTSTNSGATWTIRYAGPGLDAFAASSADGVKLAAAYPKYHGGDGRIYLSSNSGLTWATPAGAPTNTWVSIASSADGSHLVAASIFDGTGSVYGIYTSADSGVTWARVNSGNISWAAVASSTNGNRLAAAAGGIFLSTDGGQTWFVPTNSPITYWTCLASSDDGTKLAGATSTGDIWTYDSSTPLPLPAIYNQTAANLTNYSATLQAQVAPNNLDTTAWFQWGTNYENSTPAQSISGNSTAFLSANLTRLLPQTQYYFRVVATNAVGTNFGAGIAFAVAGGFFNVALPGDAVTATSTNSPATQMATNAIDGAIPSKYLNFDKLNAGFTVYPSLNNLVVQSIGLVSAEDEPERDPASFALFGSKDGTTFSLIASNSVPPFISTNAIQSLAFANTNTYVAYKIIFPTVQNPATANSMQIAEVEFLPYADITSPNDSLNLQLPNGASLNGVGPAGALLDRQVGAAANKIVVLNDSNSVVALLTPAAGASIVKGFELVGGEDDVNYPGREPVSFTLEGSNDGNHFVTLSVVTPQTPSANMQIQDFAILSNTNTYAMYRATFGLPQSGNVMQIGELRLFGVTAPKMNLSSSGNNLFLAWPASGFTLQQSSNLTTWGTATNAISVTNGQSQAAPSRATGSLFYRLKAQ
jgi:hypothetical protein